MILLVFYCARIPEFRDSDRVRDFHCQFYEIARWPQQPVVIKIHSTEPNLTLIVVGSLSFASDCQYKSLMWLICLHRKTYNNNDINAC